MSGAAKHLSHQERLDWLRLIRSQNVGPVTFYRLLERYGSAERALSILPDLARQGGGKGMNVCSAALAEKELVSVTSADARLIGFGEPDYPRLLTRVEDAPPLITVKGNPKLLRKKTVGIVGSRNASLNGIDIARDFAAAFGNSGYLVASGLARGIDTAAHKGSLETGTMAVVAGGVDVVYPKENQDLYDHIVAKGVVLSEMPMGTEPRGRHFPRRNRLISGASRGVLVVEAAPRSGSLITARMAGDQNREVFAIPGSPLDPRAQGANQLIQQGAHLAQKPEDVLDILDGLFQSNFQEPEQSDFKYKNTAEPGEDELTPARAELKKMLSPTPVEVDEVIRQCQMSPAVVSTILLELELAGRLERHPVNKVSLVGIG